MRFRKLHFSLRALLVIVTVCAILCATSWHFWPAFRAYQARIRFEKAATQFMPGMSMDDVNAIAGKVEQCCFMSDGNGMPIAWKPYFFDGAWYCVYMQQDRNLGRAKGITASDEVPCTSVKTFRLAVPPRNYSPQTQAAKDDVDPPETIRTKHMTPDGVIHDVRAARLEGEDARRSAYMTDFIEQISGRTKVDLGIKYDQLPAAQ